MNEEIVTLTKSTEAAELIGARVVYRVIVDYEPIGSIYQMKGKRYWGAVSSNRCFHLWTYRTRTEAIDGLVGGGS